MLVCVVSTIVIQLKLIFQFRVHFFTHFSPCHPNAELFFLEGRKNYSDDYLIIYIMLDLPIVCRIVHLSSFVVLSNVLGELKSQIYFGKHFVFKIVHVEFIKYGIE